MKTCKTCGEAKDTEQFYAHKNTSDGLRTDCKACHSIKCRKWSEQNPERDQYNRRSAALKRKYGIDLEEYTAILIKQDYCCGICGLKDSGTIQHDTLALDHCHETGKVRGILCDKCNRGIGLLQDSPELLKKAIEWLKK